MKAQYYCEGFKDYVRVFITDTDALMDCHIDPFNGNLKGASKALSRCNLKRKTKWKKGEWGFECRVCWKGGGK